MVVVFYIFGALGLLVLVGCSILVGACIQADKWDGDWLSDGWLLVLAVVTAATIVILSLTRVGSLKVKTIEPPVIESCITIKMEDDSVKRDTLYIYRFDYSKIR